MWGALFSRPATAAFAAMPPAKGTKRRRDDGSGGPSVKKPRKEGKPKREDGVDGVVNPVLAP